jgi:hypothetical protein
MGAAYSGVLSGIFFIILGIVEAHLGMILIGVIFTILCGLFIRFGRKRGL